MHRETLKKSVPKWYPSRDLRTILRFGVGPRQRTSIRKVRFSVSKAAVLSEVLMNHERKT